MVQSGFCPRCGGYAELVQEHLDDGSMPYVRFRGPPPNLYCRKCVADIKLLKAKVKQQKSGSYGG